MSTYAQLTNKSKKNSESFALSDFKRLQTTTQSTTSKEGMYLTCTATYSIQTITSLVAIKRSNGWVEMLSI